MNDAVDELRRHICETCLLGIEDDPVFEAVDVIHEGVRYECRDPLMLLGTPCGCEYHMDGDVPWLENAE